MAQSKQDNKSTYIRTTQLTIREGGPTSGGDLFDMAKDGTSVPPDSAK